MRPLRGSGGGGMWVPMRGGGRGGARGGGARPVLDGERAGRPRLHRYVSPFAEEGLQVFTHLRDHLGVIVGGMQLHQYLSGTRLYELVVSEPDYAFQVPDDLTRRDSESV